MLMTSIGYNIIMIILKNIFLMMKSWIKLNSIIMKIILSLIVIFLINLMNIVKINWIKIFKLFMKIIKMINIGLKK